MRERSTSSGSGAKEDSAVSITDAANYDSGNGSDGKVSGLVAVALATVTGTEMLGCKVEEIELAGASPLTCSEIANSKSSTTVRADGALDGLSNWNSSGHSGSPAAALKDAAVAEFCTVDQEGSVPSSVPNDAVNSWAFNSDQNSAHASSSVCWSVYPNNGAFSGSTTSVTSTSDELALGYRLADRLSDPSAQFTPFSKGSLGAPLESSGSIPTILTFGDLGEAPASEVLTTQIVAGSSSSGLVINIIYDSSVSSAPAGFEAAVASVVQFYESEFTNPITLNIQVGWGEIDGQAVSSGSLGESESYIQSFSYSQIRYSLIANAVSSAQSGADSSLPASAPLGGAYYLTLADATALGLLSGSTILDGYVGFSDAVSWAYNDSDGVPAGDYDLYGVIAHEISEVMGRISMLTTPGEYSDLDLFRFSAPGVRASVGTATGYFSINNGNATLNYFNSNPGGDFGDWASSAGNDSYDAFSNSGVVNPVTATDITVMNVLGYDPLIPAVTSVVDSPSSGELTIGKSVTITLVFNTVVAVTGGTPTLSLNDDGVATFVGGSGTQALTFSYTISATDKNVTALSVAEFNLDGASIADVVGTDANLSLAGLSQSGPQIYIPPIVTQIAEIYEAVLQRAPSTDEVNAAIAEEGAIGNAGVVAILVDSPEAQQNIYPVVQIIDLATGSLPAAAQLTGWVLATESGTSFDQMATTFGASTTFGNIYNNGTAVDPDAPITAGILEAIIQHATGVAATQEQVNAWMSSGLTIDQVFVDFALGEQYTTASQSAVQQDLTSLADSAAGIASSGTLHATSPSLTTAQITEIYQSVLQRAPISAEVNAAVAATQPLAMPAW